MPYSKLDEFYFLNLARTLSPPPSPTHSEQIPISILKKKLSPSPKEKEKHPIVLPTDVLPAKKKKKGCRVS